MTRYIDYIINSRGTLVQVYTQHLEINECRDEFSIIHKYLRLISFSMITEMWQPNHKLPYNYLRMMEIFRQSMHKSIDCNAFYTALSKLASMACKECDTTFIHKKLYILCLS